MLSCVCHWKPCLFEEVIPGPHLHFLWAFKQKYFSSRTHFLFCISLFSFCSYHNLSILILKFLLIWTSTYSVCRILSAWLVGDINTFFVLSLDIFQKACVYLHVCFTCTTASFRHLAIACGYSHPRKPCLNLSTQTIASSCSDVCVSLP